jgi:hypothetical protein
VRSYILSCVAIVGAMGFLATALSLLALQPERDGPLPTALLLAWRKPAKRRLAGAIGYLMMAGLVAVVIALAP